MDAPDVYCKIYCTSSLKATVNYISKDATNAIKMDMISAVSGGGEIRHPTLFLNLKRCKIIPGSAAKKQSPARLWLHQQEGLWVMLRHGTHNPP